LIQYPRRGVARPAVCVLAAGLVLAACGTQGTPAASGTPASSTASHSPVPSKQPGTDAVETSLAGQAERMGETPTYAGISRIERPGVTAFLWESVKGHVCLAESALAGELQSIKCSKTGEGGPKDPSKSSALFGPGMLNDGGRILLATSPGRKVVSVAYRNRRADVTFVRTLAPGTSGRDLYYVVLSEFPEGSLDVTIRSQGKESVEHMPLGT
jgi:hypothetical protein